MADLWEIYPSVSDMKHDPNVTQSFPEQSQRARHVVSHRAEDQLTCHRQPALLRLSFQRMFTLVGAIVMLGHRREDHLS